MQKPAQVALIGAGIAAFLTLPGLANGTLWDNSETAYAEVAREILLLHQGIVMHLNGSAWFVQPPLYFWIAAAFGKLFGIGSFAFRLPSALATVAMAAITGYAVTRAAGARAGLYATIILSTSLMQAIIGRLAIMDALLDLAVTLTMFWWWRALRTGRQAYFVCGWIAAGFGFLAKGPVALVMPLLIIIPFYVWNRRSESMHAPTGRAWLMGGGSFLCVVLPWMIALYAQTGPGALAQLLGHYTIGRYTGTIENQAGPIWYYIPVLLLGFFPWVAFLPAALIYGWNQVRARSVDDGSRSLVRLALLWTLVPLLFFSFARTKLPNYIALELPGVALLVALYLNSIVQRYRRRSLMLSAAAVPITIALLGVAIAMFSHQNRLVAGTEKLSGDLLAVGVALFIGSIITALAFLSERRAEYAPYLLGATSFVGISILAIVALPQAEQFKPIPRLAAIIERERLPGDIVGIAGVSGGNALVFYTEPGVKTVASAAGNPAEAPSLRSIICSAGRAFVVTAKRRAVVDATYGRVRRLLAIDNNDALVLYTGPPCSTIGRSKRAPRTFRGLVLGYDSRHE